MGFRFINIVEVLSSNIYLQLRKNAAEVAGCKLTTWSTCEFFINTNPTSRKSMSFHYILLIYNIPTYRISYSFCMNKIYLASHKTLSWRWCHSYQIRLNIKLRYDCEGKEKVQKLFSMLPNCLPKNVCSCYLYYYYYYYFTLKIHFPACVLCITQTKVSFLSITIGFLQLS